MLNGPKGLKKGFLLQPIANAVVETGTLSEWLGVDGPSTGHLYEEVLKEFVPPAGTLFEEFLKEVVPSSWPLDEELAQGWNSLDADRQEEFRALFINKLLQFSSSVPTRQEMVK